MYEPLGFDHFWYSSYGVKIYNKVLKRTGERTYRIQTFSGVCQFGEMGEIDLDQIDSMTDVHIMTVDDFEMAGPQNWPDGVVMDRLDSV